MSKNELIVNSDHKVTIYDRNELAIQLDMELVNINKGRVFLRKCDLIDMLKMLEEDEAWAQHRGQDNE